MTSFLPATLFDTQRSSSSSSFSSTNTHNVPRLNHTPSHIHTNHRTPVLSRWLSLNLQQCCGCPRPKNRRIPDTQRVPSQSHSHSQDNTQIHTPQVLNHHLLQMSQTSQKWHRCQQRTHAIRADAVPRQTAPTQAHNATAPTTPTTPPPSNAQRVQLYSHSQDNT